ncbi:MAG: N-acetylmuramoyl-L-alanine amidase, partial [Bacteroidetes bacterium]
METNFMLKRPPSLRAFWKLFIWLLVALPMLFGGTVWGQTNTELQLAFSKAYEKYPQIPKGLLETVSFHNTKLTHITGSSDHHEMPDVYGVMGLYDNSNLFVNTLEKVSVSSTFDKQELINSLDANILGTAMYLLELAKTHNSLNYKDYSIWRKVLESFSAVEGTDEISKFIRLEYAHRVLVSMREGVIYNGLVIEPNANILVENIFSKSDVDILNGEKLRIDITNGRVEGVDYFNAEWSPSPNYNSRGGTKITDVAIHVAEGGLTSALRTLTDPNRTARVSSHYLVSSTGRVLQLVLEANNAWHIGNGNSYTVGIEHEGFVADPNKWFTTQMYQASADLVKNICQRNGIDPKTCYRGTSNSALVDGANYHVKGHTHFPKSVNSNGHTDPGTGWNWNNYYNLINGSNCTGTTLNLTAMSMISQRGSTTDMTYKENATFNATIKNISNCTVTKVIGFVPVDPSGSQKGLLYPQTITLTAGSIKTISQPDLIQGAIGNGWKMYVVANDTEAAIQASLLNGVSNFKYPIASGGASNPYSYNVIAAPAIVSCAKPTALIGALYNGGSVQDLQIPSGSTLRTIANGTTSTSCPIASAVIYVRENGGQWNNVSVTLPFDKTNVLSNNTNISKQVEIYIRVTNSAGYTDSNILRYTILPVQTTTNPTPVPTVCQSAPTVNISNPNQTVYVDDVVNINYTVAAGTNCFVQQVNFVNTTTGQTSIGTNTSFQTNFLQAGIYQYKIEAINGYTSSFSGGTITVNPKPLLCVAPTVTLGSPANGMDYGVNSGLALFYQGTSSTQCPILEYQFNISHNGTRIVNGLPPNQPNSYVLSNMLAGTYQWEVRARNQAGWGNWSGQKSFTVTDFSATLSAPTVSVSNSGCIGSQISVDASAVPNATRYEFLIADNANMSNAQVRAANLGYYSYLFKPEEFGWGKTWYFKAKAYSANNVASPLSNTVSTTTMPDKPLVSVSQNNFNIVAGQTVMLSASGSGNLEWYNAEYGGNLLSSGNTYLVSPTANTDYWVRQSILTPTSTKCYSYSTKVSVNVTSATLS